MKNLIDFISESSFQEIESPIDQLKDIPEEVSKNMQKFVDLHKKLDAVDSRKDFLGNKLKVGDIVGMWVTGGFEVAIITNIDGKSADVFVTQGPCTNVKSTRTLLNSCFRISE